MDHVVYLETAANEMARLLDGTKTMIIRGAAGRKLPYGKVQPGDVLYFVNNDGTGQIQARGIAGSVLNSDKMTPDESAALVNRHQAQLQLTEKQLARWAGKRYLVLIEVEEVTAVVPFSFDRSAYGNMDDWLPVGEIDSVRRV
ncbi:MAG: hypothetical protein R6X34_28430 [Chloroflexota bacterium]